MTNKAFYAFCRDQRKIEPDADKKAALADVYGFLWDCGVSKAGVAWYITHRMGELKDEARRAAYQWLLDTFQGGNAQVRASGEQESPGAIRYRPITLIGYCYMCQEAHSTEEVERIVEGAQTHCKTCKQPLPEDQRIRGHVVYVCKRTGAELFADHLFIPPIKTEEPIPDEPEQDDEPEPFHGLYLRIMRKDDEQAHAG